MALPPFLTSVVGWLRAGYPEGVPQHDYLPLFALLASQLTDAEVSAIGDELAASSDPESACAIRKAITAATNRANPTDANVARSGPPPRRWLAAGRAGARPAVVVGRAARRWPARIACRAAFADADPFTLGCEVRD